MARERMVTRTVEFWNISVMAVLFRDEEEPQIVTHQAQVPGYIKEADLEKYLSTEWSTKSVHYIKMLSAPVKESKLYGMTERYFLLYANEITR